MGAYLRAARVIKPRNQDGSVVCKSADTLPFLIEVGQTVHFVPPTLRGPRSARVLAVKPLSADEWEVAFEGVQSRSDAEEIAGSFCLVSEDECQDVSPEDAPALLVGFRVVDEEFGELGPIDAISGNALQTTLQVSTARGEVLIPLVDEFVLSIDQERQVVTTSLPQGILELNVSDSAADIHEEDRAQ